MDRDEFLAMMIAELSRQKEEDPATFSAERRIKRPLDIFKKLCFDYPDVSEEEKSRLGSAIEALSFDVGTQGSAAKLREEEEQFRVGFHLHSKFLENIIFMHGTIATNTADVEGANSTTDMTVTSTNTLAASVFLSLPAKMLLCGQRRMSALFAMPGVDTADSNGNRSRNLLNWDVLIERFTSFLLSAVSSMVAGVAQAEFIRRDYFSALLFTISRLNPNVTLESMGVPEHTLLWELRRREIAGVQDGESIPLSLSQQLWVHQAMLAKDLFTLLPDTISLHLAKLLDSIVDSTIRINFATDIHASAFAPKTFPDARECLFTLILSQICTSITNRAIEAASSSRGPTLTMEELSAGKILVKKTLESLAFIASVIDRMLRYGGAGDSRHEARAYLCDLCEIAVAVDFPHSLGFSGLAGRDRRREELLASWERTNVFTMLASEVAHILFLSSEDGTKTGNVNEKLSHIDVRVIHTLSSAMLQSAQVANTAVRAFQSKFSTRDLVGIFTWSATDGGSSKSNRTHYLAGFGIAFLLGLGNSSALGLVESREELEAVDTGVLTCLSEVARCLGSRGSRDELIWGMSLMGSGLQQSLHLLLSEWQGRPAFLSALSRYRSAGRHLEWRRLCTSLFESLSSTGSSCARGNVMKIDLATCTEDIKEQEGKQNEGVRCDVGFESHDMEGVDGGDKSLRAPQASSIPPAQAEAIRVQLKKIRAAIDDEPMGSDKTD